MNGSAQPPGIGRLSKGLALLVAWAVLWAASEAVAGDWPQLLGPHRDGRADDERLARSWPSGGPKVHWQYELGNGFAGPAVVGGRVIVFHRTPGAGGDVERVEAISTDRGERLWKVDFQATYRGGVNPDLGPRCVPLVHDGRVYLFGAAGDLYCVSLADGKKRWSRSAYVDFSGQEGYFGAGSSPIVVDNKLLVNIGGRNGAGLVAFDLDTGRTLWKATTEGASYSSPTAATIDGQRHVIFVTRLNTVSVDPSDGRVRFRFPFGKRGATVNAATPLVFDGHLFVSSSYGVGAKLAKIGNNDARSVWSNDRVMSSQYSTCVYHRGHIYGIHGRQDSGVAALRCFEAKTGKIKWTETRFGMATLILADGKLLIMKTDGRLVLAEASPEGFVRLAGAEVFHRTSRALPALSNGRFYVRDQGPRSGLLKCLDL